MVCRLHDAYVYSCNINSLYILSRLFSFCDSDFHKEVHHISDILKCRTVNAYILHSPCKNAHISWLEISVCFEQLPKGIRNAYILLSITRMYTS